ncbi:MAG: response regulator transcription factor [Calditrichaceae bacterium]
MNDRKVKLLVVDDSLIIRKVILNVLSEYNIDVVGTATNGERALELFEQYQPDVVTLDITMPGMDGLRVLGKMRKINRSSKIIVVTALKDKSTGLKAIKIGARSYLTKPFSPQKLRETFEKAVHDIPEK